MVNCYNDADNSRCIPATRTMESKMSKRMSSINLVLVMISSFQLSGCWSWYTDNPKYKPEVTNAHQAPPGGPVQHLGQWVGQMFDAKLSLEILDGKCQNPTIYSDLEFQILKKDTALMKRQLDRKTFETKVYLEKGEYRAILVSFARSEVVAESTFLFEGSDKKLSLQVKCRT